MNRPRNTKELYAFLTKHFVYKHIIQKYGDCSIIDIMELSDKGYVKNLIKNRILYSRHSFVLSYIKASTLKDSWRMYINERSA